MEERQLQRLIGVNAFGLTFSFIASWKEAAPLPTGEMAATKGNERGGLNILQREEKREWPNKKGANSASSPPHHLAARAPQVRYRVHKVRSCPAEPGTGTQDPSHVGALHLERQHGRFVAGGADSRDLGESEMEGNAA